MSNYNSKEILKKYKAGSSTLKEEKFLFNNADEISSEFDLWASFVKKNKKEIPENLNQKLWTSFEEKTKRKSKFKIGILSAAASIVVLLSVFIYNTNQNKLEETKKVALLEEAKRMFNNTDNEEMYTKLLEDELVIVYIKTK